MKKIGRYDIVEELGRGAMGVVYKASDPTIGRLVAIKVLSLEPSSQGGIPGAREIFVREARAAGRLSHPGIVTIHDALEDPETHNNYIVMEFVACRTLEKVLLSGPPLETDQALDIIHQVGEALDYAHRQQIIHRDLKPANILLTEDGRVKITDFGIAKITAGEGSKRTFAVMGTPSYMSPEQVKGGEVDARSDLFSLGTVLYLMLAGEKPFAGDTAAVMFKVVYQDPVPPSHLNKKLSPGIDYLVLRCLAKDRDKRYSSAREFLEDLEDVGLGRAPRSEARFPLGELRVGERTVMTLPPALAPPGGEARIRERKSAWMAAGAGAAVVFLGALVGFEVWTSRQQGTLPSPSPKPAIVAPQTSLASGAPASEVSKTPAKKGERPGMKKPAGTGAAPKPPAKPPTRTTSVAGAYAAGHPVVASRASTPIPAGAGLKAPSPATEPASGRGTAGAKVVQVWCRHELKEGTLIVASGTQTISQWTLKGKKKGGFLGIKGGYTGTLSRSIILPAGTRELSVHVMSPEGALDLSRIISAVPPADASATLQVMIIGDQLTLNWQAKPHPKP